MKPLKYNLFGLVFLCVTLMALFTIFKAPPEQEFIDFINEEFGNEFIKDCIILQKYIQVNLITPVSTEVFLANSFYEPINTSNLADHRDYVNNSIIKLKKYINEISTANINKSLLKDYTSFKENLLDKLSILQKNIEESENWLMDTSKSIEERYLRYQENLISPLDSINAYFITIKK